MNMTEFLRKNAFSIIYFLILGLMPIIASSSITYWVVTQEETIHDFRLWEWTLFFIVACFTMAFALTPTTFVAILTGYFLSWNAILPLILSYWIASWIGFEFAKRIDGGKFLSFISEKPKVKKLIANLQKNEFQLILYARLSPVLPFAVTNVFFSFSGVKLKNFLTAGFVGMLPRTLLSIWIGSQAQAIQQALSNPNSNNSFYQILLFGLIGISFLGMGFIVKRAFGE
jgi:uncharacterized membrane protein YdjX (TVP38/TMEM64 family)